MELNQKDLEILKVVYKALDEKFGLDIKVLDIRGKSTLSDFFVIASASNISQVKAMAEEVDQAIAKIGVNLKSKEGYTSSRWILLEFPMVIVHVFNKEDREYYTLDKVWEGSPEIDLENLK